MLSSAEILHEVEPVREVKPSEVVLPPEPTRNLTPREVTLEAARDIARELKSYSVPTNFVGEGGFCPGWVVPHVAAREELGRTSVGRKVGAALLAEGSIVTFPIQEGEEYTKSVRHLGVNPDYDRVEWLVENVEESLRYGLSILAGLATSEGARRSVKTQPAHAA